MLDKLSQQRQCIKWIAYYEDKQDEYIAKAKKNPSMKSGLHSHATQAQASANRWRRMLSKLLDEV